VEPRFLTIEEVKQLHGNVIARYGGSRVLLNLGYLESAIAVPAQGVGGHYLHNTIPAMAAAYLYHITSNHPFEDGNKRVGTLACAVFLDQNGWTLNVDNAELETVVFSIASGELSKEECTKYIENNANRQ
jgi:death-on-curing protein